MQVYLSNNKYNDFQEDQEYTYAKPYDIFGVKRLLH